VHFAVHVGTARGAGSGVVCRNILAWLPVVGADHRFTFWAPEEWRARPDIVEAVGRSNVAVRWTRRGLKEKFIDENVRIRRFLHAERPDALFSAVDTTLPGCPVPHLLFVQQAYLAYRTDELGFALDRRTWARMRAMALYLRLGLPTVNRVTVQTEDMKARLSRRFRVPAQTIDVIPSSIPEVSGTARHDAVGGPPFLAYVATASPHKNFVVLASMMQRLRDLGHAELVCRLTVTPDDVPALAAEARRQGVFDRFVFEGRVPPERAMALMAGAEAVVMPTWLESFGITFYEAMAMGSPVVAGDRDFAREACGEAAEYADPASGRSFADAVQRVLQGDREAYARASRARIAEVKASWEDIAGRYLTILEALGSAR